MSDELRFQPGAPGEWLALAQGRQLVVVRAAADQSLVDALWKAAHGVGGATAVLDRLTESGLSSTPSFALLDWSSADAVHLIVRGPVEILLRSGAGETRVSGERVSTWVEQNVPAVAGFSVTVAPAVTGPTLPLSEGAAWVSAISRGIPDPVPDALEGPPVPEALEGPEAPEPPPIRTERITAMPIGDVPGLHSQATVVPENTLAAPMEPERLDDATQVRGAAAGPPAAIPGQLDDHDGLTVLSGDIVGLRARPRIEPPTQAARPVPWLELPSGEREPLSQPILIGRSPSVSKVPGGKVPRLVTIAGDQDISRNHVQLSLEGDTVVVTDLHSRNGTSIILPGRASQLLRAGEATAVIAGTVIDLGGGVTLTVGEG